MRKYEVLVLMLLSFSGFEVALAGELCQKHNIEFVTNEAGKYTHLAKGILYKYDYYAKELLAQHPTSQMDECVKRLMAPLVDLEGHIAANKAYDDLEGCEKYELISMVAKAFTKKYTNGQPSYFQTCLNEAGAKSSDANPEAKETSAENKAAQAEVKQEVNTEAKQPEKPD